MPPAESVVHTLWRLEPTMRSLIFLMAVIVCSAQATLRAQDRVYREPGAHWTVKVPPGWRTMSAESVAEDTAQAQKHFNGKVAVQYTSGFVLTGKTDFEFPSILVQMIRMPLDGVSFESLESSLGATSANFQGILDAASPDIISNVQLDRPVLDRERKRLYTTVRSEVADVGVVRGVAVGFLGRNGIVQLSYSAPESEFESGLSAFERMTESFAFDPGYVYQPKTGLWLQFVGGVVGFAILALVGWVLRRLFHRGRDLRVFVQPDQALEARWFQIHDELDALQTEVGSTRELEQRLKRERLDIETVLGERT